MSGTGHQTQAVEGAQAQAVSLRTMSSDINSIGQGFLKPKPELITPPPAEQQDELRLRVVKKSSLGKTMLLLLLLVGMGVGFYIYLYPLLKDSLGAQIS